MKTCESKLKMLEDIVNVANRGVGAMNKATRAFGSFRLARKKRDIQGFENQLYDAISLLSLTLTANSTLVHSQSIGHLLEQVTATNKMTATNSKDLLLMKSSLSSGINRRLSAVTGTNIYSSKPLVGSKIWKYRSNTISSISGAFGSLVFKKVTKTALVGDEHGSSSATTYERSETTWVFVPSFLSYAFNFRHLNTCGRVERSLRTYPFLPFNHSVWEMCGQGDLEGIQKLLSNGQISPFCVDPYGNTLLNYSTWAHNAAICSFLFEIGLTGEETNLGGLSCVGFISLELKYLQDKINDLADTYETIARHTSDLEALPFPTGLFESYLEPPIDLFKEKVHKLMSKENINSFVCNPLGTALSLFANSTPNNRHPWRPIIQHLIHLGSDLYCHDRQSSSNKPDTMADALMNAKQVDTPFDSVLMGREWLDVLQESGVSVLEYLRTEYSLHYNPIFSLPMMETCYFTDYRLRYLVISEEPPSISWEWFIDSTGVAYHVLEEFKNFGPGRHNLHVTLSNLTRSHTWSWPFFYYRWQWYAYMKQGGNDRFELHYTEHVTAARLAELRFERRWQKKTLKLAKAQGIIHRGPKMPGAWID